MGKGGEKEGQQEGRKGGREEGREERREGGNGEAYTEINPVSHKPHVHAFSDHFAFISKNLYFSELPNFEKPFGITILMQANTKNYL